MRPWLIGGGLCAVLVAAAVAGGGSPSTESDGKAIFLGQKCNLCHAVASVGIEAKIKSEEKRGPDLGTVKLPDDDTLLKKYLLKEAEIDGKEHKKAFKGSDEELTTLLAWMRQLDPGR